MDVKECKLKCLRLTKPFIFVLWSFLKIIGFSNMIFNFSTSGGLLKFNVYQLINLQAYD